MTTYSHARTDRLYSTSVRRGGRFAQRLGLAQCSAGDAKQRATVRRLARAATATTLVTEAFCFTISDVPRSVTWYGEEYRKSGPCRSPATRRAACLNGTTLSRKPTFGRPHGEWRKVKGKSARSRSDSNPSLDILWTYLHIKQCKIKEWEEPISR